MIQDHDVQAALQKTMIAAGGTATSLSLEEWNTILSMGVAAATFFYIVLQVIALSPKYMPIIRGWFGKKGAKS